MYSLLIRNENVGTLNKPELFAISSGNRSGQSLIFHFKIGSDYHNCILKRVNGSSCNFHCVDTSCKARHKGKVNPSLVTCIENFHVMKNGRTRHKYDVDRSNPAIRELKNWTMLPHTSKPHLEKCRLKEGIYDPIKKDFRENHTTASLVTFELEIKNEQCKINE